VINHWPRFKVRTSCDSLSELAFTKSRHWRLLCARVHMLKLTEEREITPYTWVRPQQRPPLKVCK
jgi:hypothetical protein